MMPEILDYVVAATKRQVQRRLIYEFLVLLVLAFSFVFHSFSMAQTQDEELDALLRSWITQNIYFEKDQNGHDILLIRKKPVRVYIRSDHPDVVRDAREAVANLANAFGLEYEFTDEKVNMIIATVDDVADNGRPNRSVLNSFGLMPSYVDSIVKTQIWPDNCGIFDSPGNDGRLIFSIALGDNALASAKISSCIVAGVISAFGLRIHGRAILDNPRDYVQFLLLARSLKQCDKKIESENSNQSKSIRDEYVSCTLAELKKRLSKADFLRHPENVGSQLPSLRHASIAVLGRLRRCPWA